MIFDYLHSQNIEFKSTLSAINLQQIISQTFLKINTCLRIFSCVLLVTLFVRPSELAAYRKRHQTLCQLRAMDAFGISSMTQPLPSSLRSYTLTLSPTLCSVGSSRTS
jgi:hypothetical protein